MLIDLPFQSRIVEMLIIHKDFIFGTHSHQAGNIFPFSGRFCLIRCKCSTLPYRVMDNNMVVVASSFKATSNLLETFFAGFKAQPSFRSSDRGASESSISPPPPPLSPDAIQSAADDSTISLDRDILLSFDDDQVSTSTDNTNADSQYNTVISSAAWQQACCDVTVLCLAASLYLPGLLQRS